MVNFDQAHCEFGLCSGDPTVTDEQSCANSPGTCTTACVGCSSQATCEATYFCSGTNALKTYLEKRGITNTGACFGDFSGDINGYPYCENGQATDNPWGMIF